MIGLLTRRLDLQRSRRDRARRLAGRALRRPITGAQLLVSGGAVWFTNAIAFGLAFWELDCGGPVARALATAPRKPDFQFPQDENPQLARVGWAPRLWDYFYVSLTNSMAFSPTDAMPLTRPAKALMAAESMLSARHGSARRRARREHPRLEVRCREKAARRGTHRGGTASRAQPVNWILISSSVSRVGTEIFLLLESTIVIRSPSPPYSRAWFFVPAMHSSK